MSAPFRISVAPAAVSAYSPAAAAPALSPLPAAASAAASVAAPAASSSPTAASAAAAPSLSPPTAAAPPLAAPAPAAPRKAVAAASPAPAQNTPLQGYMDRLLKLIPAEVVAIYLVGIGVIPTNARGSIAMWAVICLGLVVLSRAYGTADQANKVPPEWKSVLVSSISFVVWVYNMPGPFQAYGLAISYVGALAVLVWTFVVPYVYRG